MYTYLRTEIRNIHLTLPRNVYLKIPNIRAGMQEQIFIEFSQVSCLSKLGSATVYFCFPIPEMLHLNALFFSIKSFFGISTLRVHFSLEKPFIFICSEKNSQKIPLKCSTNAELYYSTRKLLARVQTQPIQNMLSNRVLTESA